MDQALAPGAVVAQALHAVIEFIHDYPKIENEWRDLSNSVVALSASAAQLEQLIEKCKKNNVRYSVFREPDMDNRLTAVAIEPTRNGKRVTSNYRLALRDL